MAQDPPARRSTRTDVIGCWRPEDEHGLIASRTIGGSAPFVMSLTTLADSSHWREDFPTAKQVVRYDSIGRNQASGRPLIRSLATLWTADSLSDTIRVKFGNGFTGVWFRFAVAPELTRDTLWGVAEKRFDDRPPQPLVRARAVRVVCP